jgi:hypothetical protein
MMSLWVWGRRWRERFKAKRCGFAELCERARTKMWCEGFLCVGIECHKLDVFSSTNLGDGGGISFQVLKS